MPFKSEAQRRFLWARHPSIARRWADTYGTPKNLPQHVDGKSETETPAAEKKGEGVPMLTFEKNVIDTLLVAAAALDKAEAAYRKKQAEDKRVAELTPEAVEECLRHNRVDPEDREKLAATLGDHAKCVQLVIKLAGHRNVEEASHLGGQVDSSGRSANGLANGHTKKAAYGSVDSPYCGGRSSEDKPSDLNFWRDLGLPMPS